MSLRGQLPLINHPYQGSLPVPARSKEKPTRLDLYMTNT